MMKNLTVALLFLSLVACKPQRMVERTTIIRDTTIYVHFPADTLHDTVVVREGAFSILDLDYASSVAWINRGKLFHRLEQQEKNVPVTIKQAIKTTNTNLPTKYQYPTNQESQGLKALQKVQVFLGNVLMIALVGWILVKLITNLPR